MSHQSELALENELIAQLVWLEYDPVTIRHEADLIANLKTQLEIHNHVNLHII